MRHYIALVHKERDSDYGVSFPDFPGCVTAGRTMDEAVKMAVEALSGHIGLMADSGQAIPAPSSIETIMSTAREEAGWPMVIQVAEPKTGAVRLSVTLPEDLLKEIDAFAKRQGYTRSGLLAHAAKSMIERAPRAEARTTRKRSRVRLI
jgi:predicted RNase H-like HicB family nuclease